MLKLLLSLSTMSDEHQLLGGQLETVNICCIMLNVGTSLGIFCTLHDALSQNRQARFGNDATFRFIPTTVGCY
jgi:hypothetical protein